MPVGHYSITGVSAPHHALRRDFDGALLAHPWDRGGPRDDVVVVANFSSADFSGYRVGFRRGRGRVNTDWSGYDLSFGNQSGYDTDTDTDPVPWDGMPVSADVGVGGYSIGNPGS